MKENNLGSISSIVNPLSGHANFVEKINFSIFLNFFGKVSSSYSTNKSPLASCIDVSIPSASRFPKDEFRTILSKSEINFVARFILIAAYLDKLEADMRKAGLHLQKNIKL